MIVIPMAGRSQRFFDAGYTRPKFELELQGRSVFAHAVGSFAAEFTRRPFLFIAQGEAEPFVRAEAKALGVAEFEVVSLGAPTAGQAETVELGVEAVGWNGALTIFNIDTFRPGFAFPGPEMPLKETDDFALERERVLAIDGFAKRIANVVQCKPKKGRQLRVVIILAARITNEGRR